MNDKDPNIHWHGKRTRRPLAIWQDMVAVIVGVIILACVVGALIVIGG